MDVADGTKSINVDAVYRTNLRVLWWERLKVPCRWSKRLVEDAIWQEVDIRAGEAGSFDQNLSVNLQSFSRSALGDVGFAVANDQASFGGFYYV